MNRIIENIKDFLFLITHSNYWLMSDTLRYSEEYDRWFNELLDNNEFTHCSKYVARLGGFTFWIANIPYYCFNTINIYDDYIKYGTLRSSRRTIHKAFYKLNKFLKDRE